MNRLQVIYNNILKCKSPQETVEEGIQSELKKNIKHL